MKYDIEFSNGVKLQNCEENGTGFSVVSEVSLPEITGGLRRVKITARAEGIEGERELLSGEYEYMRLGYYGVHNGVLTLVLNPCDERERELLRQRGDIDYIAMMLGVEL